MSFAHALKWSFLSELAAKGIQPVVFIVLARLLTPEDFGVMTAAIMVIAFSQIFWEAGMGKALIQRQTDVEEAANFAFWVNLCLGLLIAGLLFWGAQPIAMTFFKDPRVTAVLQVMALQVLLGALSSVQTALLQKEMAFKKLFWVRITAVTLPGIASIPLAWAGFGYWSLVAGMLAGQLIQALMLWRISIWRPTIKFQFSIAGQMSRFGTWVGLTGLLAWLFGWADSLIIGMYLGTHDLGIYRVGQQIVSLAYTVIFAPILPVAYSFYANKLHGSPGKMTDIHALVMANNSGVTLALAISAMMVISSSFVITLLGSRWGEALPVIMILSLTHAISYCFLLNNEYYRAMGRADMETKLMLFVIPFYIFAAYMSAKFGLVALVLTRLLVVIVVGTSANFICEKMVFNKQVTNRMYYLLMIFISMVPLYWHYITAAIWGVDTQPLAALASFLLFAIIVYWQRHSHFIFQLKTLLRGR